LAQARPEFTSLARAGDGLDLIAAARGETVAVLTATVFTSFAVPETCWIGCRRARREQGVAGGGVDGDGGKGSRAEGDEEITCFSF